MAKTLRFVLVIASTAMLAAARIGFAQEPSQRVPVDHGWDRPVLVPAESHWSDATIKQREWAADWARSQPAKPVKLQPKTKPIQGPVGLPCDGSFSPNLRA